MRNINTLTLTLLMMCVIFSCKKDTEKFAKIPSLEFVKITPSVAAEFVDEVKITVLYRDKDGDIGENDPEVKNLFVTDNRNDVEYSFRIPELTPEGSEIAVEGNFEINLKIIEKNLLKINGQNISITKQGIFIADQIIREFIRV